eukprot:18126_1
MPSDIYYGTGDRRRLVIDDIVDGIFGTEDVPGLGIAVEGVQSVTDGIASTVSAIPGISEAVGGITETANGIKGLTEKIPGIGTNVNNILNSGIPGINGNLGNIIHNGIPGLGGQLLNIQNVGIPGLGGQLLNIQNVGIPGLNGKLSNIINVGIPGIDKNVTKIIELMITNPMDILDILGDDAEELGNTLRTCFNPLLDLVDPFNVIDKILELNPIHLDIINGIPDIEAIAFKILAVALLPLKANIDLACKKVLPEAVASIKAGMDGVTGSRRRLQSQVPKDSDVCLNTNPSDFCPSKNTSYFYDADVDNNMYRNMAENTPRLIPEERRRDNANPEIFQEYRIVKFTFDLVLHIVDIVCGIANTCMTGEVKAASCKKAETHNVDGMVFTEQISIFTRLKPHICTVIKAAIQLVNSVLNYMMGSATLHNGAVNNMRLKAIFEDRIAIIHNQKYLEHVINENINDKYNNLRQLIQRVSLASTTNVQNVKLEIELAEKTSIKSVLAKLDQIHVDVITGNNIQQTRVPTPSPSWQPTPTPVTPAKKESSMKIDESQWQKNLIKDIDAQSKDNGGTGLIRITLELRDLYVFVAVFIGCCLLFMVIGIVIGKCIYESRAKHGFSAVPKYDYSASDVDENA